MKHNPHNLKFDQRGWLDILTGIPVMLALFPIPLAFPACVIGLCFEQPEEWPLAVMYFTWLTASIILIYVNQKDI